MKNQNHQDLTIQNNIVVTLDYTLKVDNEIVDQSDEHGPIQFLQGSGQIISGLERELYGLKIGDKLEVIVPPADGYGELDVDAVGTVPLDEFPSDFPLEKGINLQLKDKDDELLDAYVEDLDDENVYLNFNHPLAGKELHFSITIIDLREATAEEISHGHVHSNNGHK